jgi:hypothetical protein
MVARRLRRSARLTGRLRGHHEGASKMNINDWFLDVLPFKRKTSADWIVPVIVGLGVGVAIGAGVGLLLAPTTGEEARLKLREGAHRVKDRAADLADRAKDRIAKTADEARGQLNQA